eukprot:scaffold31746_cov71-Phaeocystis_antarctica.AAC.5
MARGRARTVAWLQSRRSRSSRKSRAGKMSNWSCLAGSWSHPCTWCRTPPRLDLVHCRSCPLDRGQCNPGILPHGSDPSGLSTIPPHTQWASKRLGCPIASGSTIRPHIPRMLLGPALLDTCPKHMRSKRAASTRWRTFQSSKA